MTTGLEGRVVLVTGGGRGLGRAHSLLLAALGAKVVVNDLGGAGDGSGRDALAADEVVQEIAAAGGEAVANSDNVAAFDGAKSMITAAVEAFGDLHAVVNNAGILRDRMLVSMTEDDWDAVIAVHLKGTFNVTRHAADFWRDRAKGGDRGDRAIVNTVSMSGLHGNVGQVNYAAAKAGIAAMTLVSAMELGRYGVRANCVAPVARTRLTLQTPGLAESMADNWIFDPENTAALVACLAAAGCPFNGQVFSIYGGSVGLYGGWSIAHEVTSGGPWTFSEMRAALETLPTSVPVVTQADTMARNLQAG